eukprot:814561-Amphidinium_carterae.1
MKPRPMKGRGKMIGVRRPPPGSIVTNLYHAHITNFHAVAPPMTTMPTTNDMATGADTRATPQLQQQPS